MGDGEVEREARGLYFLCRGLALLLAVLLKRPDGPLELGICRISTIMRIQKFFI
jgi:hypothetical protein